MAAARKSRAKTAPARASRAQTPAAKTPAAGKTAAEKRAAPNKAAAKKQVPYVDYLVLGKNPYLRANECKKCGVRYFDRRNACAKCFNTEFKRVRVKSSGVVTSFTIVSYGPYVSAIVDCGGTPVKATIVGTDNTPNTVSTGMKVKLVTVPAGEKNGVEAVSFAFAPA